MTPAIPQKELPGLHYSMTLKPSVDLALCQAKLPLPLFVALRAQMAQDGLSWRQVFRWAALQYLATRDEDRAHQVWSQCV